MFFFTLKLKNYTMLSIVPSSVLVLKSLAPILAFRVLNVFYFISLITSGSLVFGGKT